MLLDPLVYYTAALDFHLEATATFFAVFAAYDIWAGRYRRTWIWIGLCLLCGDLGGLWIAGVGISAVLAGRSTRRLGALVIGAGVAWVGLITLLHANQGSFLDQYAYLAGRSTLPTGFRGALAVLSGLITHPRRPFKMLISKARMIWRYLPPGGVIGLITPWGIGVPAIVLLSSALQNNTLFIGEPFQQFAVVPFVLIGSVTLVTALVANSVPSAKVSRLWSRNRTLRLVMASILLVGILFGGLRYAHEYLRMSFTNNATKDILPATEATALSTVLARTPSGAEVIASGDIIGRFGARHYCFVYQSAKSAIPLRAKTVELIMDTAHDPFLHEPQWVAAAGYVESRFHARNAAAPGRRLGAHVGRTGSDVVRRYSLASLSATAFHPTPSQGREGVSCASGNARPQLTARKVPCASNGCRNGAVIVAVDTATVASLATAAGTLVLAVATFSAVRSSNRSARIAEGALQEQRRPVLAQSRLNDPKQKIMFLGGHWVSAEGAAPSPSCSKGWCTWPSACATSGRGSRCARGGPYSSPTTRRPVLAMLVWRITGYKPRDLYIPAGDIGMWQGRVA